MKLLPGPSPLWLEGTYTLLRPGRYSTARGPLPRQKEKGQW